MKVLVMLATLAVLANLVYTRSKMNTRTRWRNEPESHRHHHYHQHYHRYDQIFGPYVERLLQELIKFSKSSNDTLCADNRKETESTETRIEEPLRSGVKTDFEPKQIMVVIPSPSGEPTWTLEEVTAAVDEPNNEFREYINKAYRTIAEKETTGDLQNSEPWIIPVSSTNEDAGYESGTPPEFIPYVPPSRRKAGQDDGDKKKLHVVIPSPVGARTWTAGELMNAVGILDKSDKYKAVLKRAYDIVKQKIYNGELQNFRTIEITMPASEMSKWTAVELENALRSRRLMPNSEETSKELKKKSREEEILSTITPADLLHSTQDHELLSKSKEQCN